MNVHDKSFPVGDEVARRFRYEKVGPSEQPHGNHAYGRLLAHIAAPVLGSRMLFPSRFDQAVDRLPSQQKKVYHLIKEHGMKREEAAVELNLSPETVKRHLSEAMQFIRVYCLSHLGVYGALIIMKGLL